MDLRANLCQIYCQENLTSVVALWDLICEKYLCGDICKNYYSNFR